MHWKLDDVGNGKSNSKWFLLFEWKKHTWKTFFDDWHICKMALEVKSPKTNNDRTIANSNTMNVGQKMRKTEARFYWRWCLDIELTTQQCTLLFVLVIRLTELNWILGFHFRLQCLIHKFFIFIVNYEYAMHSAHCSQYEFMISISTLFRILFVAE